MSAEARILVAGIGNIFMGDDAFGVEVVAVLAQRKLPEAVRVVDFGIRSYDLAFALTDPYQAVVLVDAVPRGEPGGTVYLIELDLNELPELENESADAHCMNPVTVLQMAQSLGGIGSTVFLVGCEPTQSDCEDGQLGLSAPVRAAVPQGVAMVEELVSKLLACGESAEGCLEAGGASSSLIEGN